MQRRLHLREGLQKVLLISLIIAGLSVGSKAARHLSAEVFPKVAQEPEKDGPLIAAVINPTGFHFEVVFGVVQCLAELAQSGVRVEADLYLGSAAVANNFLGIKDTLSTFNTTLKMSYPMMMIWQKGSGLSQKQSWAEAPGEVAPMRRPHLCIAVSPEYSIPYGHMPLLKMLKCGWLVGIIHGGTMGTTAGELLADMALYERWQLRYNEFITLGAHVSASIASDLNITTQWAIPVFRLKQALARAAALPGTGNAAVATAEPDSSSSSSSTSPCRAHVTVQGKMDGRRALSPLWAGLEQAGLGQQQAGVCVQVLGSSHGHQADAMAALLAIPPSLNSHVQFKPDLPYDGFYRTITSSLALLPAILDTGAQDAGPATSQGTPAAAASSRDLAVASPAQGSQITVGEGADEQQATSSTAPPVVDRSEYMTKRFTSSVLTSLICETPLLSTSQQEHSLLSQVYGYLADAGALLGPSQCPLPALAAIQLPAGGQDLKAGGVGDGSSKRRRRRQNARRHRLGGGEAGGGGSSSTQASAVQCLEALQSGQAALSGVVDRLNAQFVGMLKEWLGKGRARLAAARKDA